MAPLHGDNASTTATATAARGTDSARQQRKPTRTTTHKHVHFTREPPACHEQLETYYPTPSDAQPVVPTASLRRLTIDEVELLFSEPLAQRPVTPRDFAVHAIRGRDEFLACGCVADRKLHMGITVWRTCWAELYHGVLMLRKCTDALNVSQKRTLVPIADCTLAFAKDDHVLALQYEFQGQPKRRVLRFASANELSLWWWALQIAAMSPVDGRVLHRSMSRPALSPRRFLATAESAAESVFLPHALRETRPTPGVATPNTANSVQTESSGSRTTKSHKSDETAYVKTRSSLCNSICNSSNTGRDRSNGVAHVIFVRHGEAENMHFRVCDREKQLTTRGHEQAEQTAQWLRAQLSHDRVASHNDRRVTLIYGSLRRCVETATLLAAALPWLEHNKFECRLLDEGTPLGVKAEHRHAFRDAMHKLAFEYICRWDDSNDHSHTTATTKHRRSNSSSSHRQQRPVRDSYKIVVCHASFIQYCVAQCYGVAHEVIQLGAPIAHCSVTQIDVLKGGAMDAECTNRVTHLPLTHRTSD